MSKTMSGLLGISRNVNEMRAFRNKKITKMPLLVTLLVSASMLAFIPAAAAVIVINPHINLTKTPNQSTVLSGSAVNYTYVVTNNGDQTLTNVSIRIIVASIQTPSLLVRP